MQQETSHQPYGLRREFDGALFACPETERWPVYMWGWNGTITREGIRDQLDAMARRGIRGIYIIATPADFRPNRRPTPLEPDFDTDEYYALYRYAADYAARKGMAFWLYDEPGFPSGSADGRVVMADPDVEKKGLSRSERMLRAGETYVKPDDVLGAFVLDNDPVGRSYTAHRDVLLAEYRVVTEKPYPMATPDLLDDRAAPILLRVLFEKYRRHIGHLFGRQTRILFIDEPAAPVFPWTRGFEERFRERFGYEIRDYLPAILNPYLQGEKGVRARIDYYELNSLLFMDRYFLTQRKWCRRHGLLLGGHVGGEDETDGCIRHGYLHLMRMLRSMDVPGVDAIWRQIFPGKRKTVQSNLGKTVAARNHFFPRCASSAASQSGGNFSLTETGAVYGAGLTFAQLRYVTLFQMVRGINIINYMGVYYSSRDHLMASARPNFTEEIPHSSDMAVFNEYIARLCYLMSTGTIAADTALYMPVRDIWAGDALSAPTVECYEQAAFALERMQCCFDIFDDDVILSADESALHGGVAAMGLAAYTTLIIPGCRFMPDEVKARIERFAAGGGRVVALAGDGPSSMLRGAVSAAPEELCAHIKPAAGVEPPCDGLRVLKRRLDGGGAIYLITNEDDESVTRTLRFDETLPVYEADPLTGEIRVPGHRVTADGTEAELRLLWGEGRALIFTGRPMAVSPGSRPEPHGWTCRQALTDFTFRRLRSFTVGEEKLENNEIRESEVPAAPGDWRGMAGEDFSGDALYVTQFERPFDTGVVGIDLGDVRYACEAFVNGKSLGVRCMPPYAYRVRAQELEPRNTLSIRVSNTAANQFVARDSWLIQKYTLKQLGDYHPLCVFFERDSLPSGLFGPVRICAE